MPKLRSARRRYRSARRWWTVTAIAVSLSVVAGVVVAIDHGAPQSQEAMDISAVVKLQREAGGWGSGGYVMMPGPGQSAAAIDTVEQTIDRPATRQLSASWESSKQWQAWYESWLQQSYQYWYSLFHLRGRGHGATPSPAVTLATTPTSTPAATAVSSPAATSTATATSTPASTPAVTATDTPTGTATATPADTAASTATGTATDTATDAPTGTATATPADTATGTATGTATDMPTGTATATPADTSTSTATGTATDMPTGTATATPADTATSTPTGTATATATATPTASPTTAPTGTPTTTPTATPTPTPTTPTGTGVTAANSLNWAGYAVTGAAGSFTSVASGWIVPAVTCNGTDTHASFWVGLDGDGTSTVEQIGTEGDCDGDAPVYSGWFEMFPNAPVFFDEPVKPGDIMEASVTAQGAGVFMLTLFDMTQNWSQITEQTSPTATLGSAEIIAEAPSQDGLISPLSNFGTVVYEGAAINNAAIASPINEISMQSAEGVTLAVPSAISGGVGNFSVAWDAGGP
jgi:hypothetical protein